MDRAAYVYCVIRSARKPRAAGVPAGLPGSERPDVSPIDDGLWMVSAPVPLDRYGSGPLEASFGDLEWVGRIALAHEAVVEHFVRGPGAAVIPMKLFTMFSTVERAASEMRSRRRALDAAFDRIDGCEEWGVRVTRTDAPGKARGSKRPARPESGAAFLAARKQARDEARTLAAAAARAADAAFASLSAIARDGRRRAAETAGVSAPVLDAAFLVPAARRARFHAAAARVAKQIASSGARLTLTGPWPAYNFVNAPGVEEEL